MSIILNYFEKSITHRVYKKAEEGKKMAKEGVEGNKRQ